MTAPRKRQTRKKASGPDGRIVTFYSYKGGTGRSMAVANIAWILASHGKRVLVIDWDLEAPGLHRYFHPFLDDSDLTQTAGLIDFFVEVASASRRSSALKDQEWWRAHTSLLRYTVPLEWEFPGKGVIDFVPAGRQDVSYPTRVTSFDWDGFYRDLGGGLFLEALKRQLRSEYDYVLVDSRTGISDTAGICTVQMPDALVVCFTLNRQSIRGAASAAASAHRQRMRPDNAPGLTVWPVPTRIELGEKERLDAARAAYRTEFLQFIAHLPRALRDDYWSEVEVLYQPYFAYEEVLSVFAERRPHKGSLLSSFQALTSRLTDGEVALLPAIPEGARVAALARFTPTTASPETGARTVFLSHGVGDSLLARKIEKMLSSHGVQSWSPDAVRPGQRLEDAIAEAIDQSAAVIAIVGSRLPPLQEKQLQRALAQHKLILPVFVSKTRPPGVVGALVGVQSKGNTLSRADFLRLVDALPSHTLPVDPDDPQKGAWGGEPSRNGRRLTAKVKGVGDGWYEVGLVVVSTDVRRPLSGQVEFHLHPTFSPSIRTVGVKDGKATLELEGYGAFTVGAKVDGGATRLELDLAKIAEAPKAFRER